MIRSLSPESLFVLLSGAGGPGVLPPVTPAVSPGDQPASDKALNFCPVAGFYAEFSGPLTFDVGVSVDEKTQTF